MLIKLHTGVQVGDFIRRAGHRANDDGRWRKVIDITGPRADVLVTIDRNGHQREFAWRQNRRWKVWEPGDPREDGK